MKREYLIGAAIITSILLILSIAAHTATYFGIDPQVKFPAVWLLHFGIFIVFIPAFIAYRNEYGGRFGNIDHESVMRRAPEWMRILLKVFIIYTAINFGLFFVNSEAGAPDIWEGQYVLQNKGTLIRELSQDEYERYQMYEVRGFSGHWLIFYYYPLIAYYSILHKDDEEEVLD